MREGIKITIWDIWFFCLGYVKQSSKCSTLALDGLGIAWKRRKNWWGNQWESGVYGVCFSAGRNEGTILM